MSVIFLGPPGAGKGTQARLLGTRYSEFFHFSTGESLREISKSPESAKKFFKDDPNKATDIYDIISAGKFVNDDDVMHIVYQSIKNLSSFDRSWPVMVEIDKSDELLKKNNQDYLKGWYLRRYIFDGIPRTYNQATMLTDVLKECQKNNILIENIKGVLNFVIPDDELVKRLVNRLQCNNCNRVYSSLIDGVKVDDICNSCSAGKLYIRKDDEEKAIRNRIFLYNENNNKLLDYYEKLLGKDKICNIDAVGEVESVFTSVFDKLSLLYHS